MHVYTQITSNRQIKLPSNHHWILSLPLCGLHRKKEDTSGKIQTEFERKIPISYDGIESRIQEI